MNDLNESVVGSEGSSSLPAIIKMFQYNHDWSLGLVTDTNGITRVGTTGNQYLEYAFECEHTSDDDNCGFDFIIKRLAGTKFPTFRKEELTDNFYIIKITDFGHQTMSKFYTDFVPEVYFSGKKLFNKYVGTLKDYSSKTEFLLIPKQKSTNIEIPTNEKGTVDCDDNKCIVKIVAKTNIENKVYNYSLEKCSDESNSFYGYYCTKNVDFGIFNKNSIDDFEIYINNSSQKLTLENKCIEEIVIEECDSSGTVISTQTIIDKNNDKSNIATDYFRQLFNQQYSSEQNNISRNDCNINIWIKFSSRFDINSEVILRLKSKDKRSYYGKIPETCNIYRIISEDGETLFGKPDNLENCEIVPVYNNIHKLTKKITKTSSVLKTLRNYGYYQGYLKRPQIDIYKTNGDFVKTIFGDAEIEEESIVVVYDNHDADDIFNPTENIPAEDDSIGALSNQNVYLGEIYTNITSTGTIIDGTSKIVKLSSVSPSLIGITESPIEPAISFPKIFAIAKYSFFKYNTYIYDDHTYIFKLPKLPIDSASIAKSFESTVHIENVQPMRIINSYEIFGSEVLGTTIEDNTLKVNTFNIINFNERNQAGSSVKVDKYSL